MKYLKLIVIFLVVAAGLYFVFNLGSLFSPSKKTTGDFGEQDDIDVNELCKRMESAWVEAPEWDESLYVDWFNIIEQKKGGKLVTKKSYDMLHSTLFEYAANKLRDSFSASLLAENYSHSKVKTMHDGVAVLEQYEELKTLSGQPRLSHINDVFDLYSKIYAFVHKKHSITPSFNKTNQTWTPFNTLQSNILKQASNYRNNALYAEMNTLPDFVNGLDEKKLRDETEKYRDGFYTDLSKDIRSYFEYEVMAKDTATLANVAKINVNGSEVYADLDKLTNERQRQLGKVWQQFSTEENGEGLKKLGNFKNRFGKAMSAKEAYEKREDI